MSSSSTSKGLLIALFLLSLLSFSSSSFSFSKESSIAKDGRMGFTSQLIHRDSPQSPFYNPNLTQSERVREAVHRSFARYRYFESFSSANRANPNWAQAPMTPFNGEYVMKYYIGTPPTETFAIADTASGLIWLQCLPCESCFKQITPIFDPMKSSSYAKIRCTDEACKAWPTVRCDKDDSCYYGISYEDSAYSQGTLSSETLRFGNSGPPGGNISLTEMVFGCGHKNEDTVEVDTTPGIIGLNRQSLSFVGQLLYDHFSYCLVESKKESTTLSSTIHFGLSAVFTDETTPILDVGQKDYFYYLSLEGISVGKTRLNIPAGTFNVTPEGEGGFIIDSGATFTAIKSSAYVLMTTEMQKQINLEKVPNPPKDLSLCYKCRFEDLGKTPDLTFHFTGVDLVLSKLSTWVDVGTGIYCLAMLTKDSGPSILGNYQQQNLNVGYDLHKKIISFENTDCSNA